MGVMILDVTPATVFGLLEVLVEHVDPLGQERDLDLRGATVILMDAVLGDDLGAAGVSNGHLLSFVSAQPQEVPGQRFHHRYAVDGAL